MTSFVNLFLCNLLNFKISICFLEIKDVARICQDLLKNWAFRGEKGPDRPLINGFNVTKDERRLRQVVFLLSVSFESLPTALVLSLLSNFSFNKFFIHGLFLVTRTRKASLEPVNLVLETVK